MYNFLSSTYHFLGSYWSSMRPVASHTLVGLALQMWTELMRGTPHMPHVFVWRINYVLLVRNVLKGWAQQGLTNGQGSISEETELMPRLSKRGRSPKRNIISRKPQHQVVGFTQRQRGGWGLKPHRRRSRLVGGQLCILFRP